jgi:hypothetical protein
MKLQMYGVLRPNGELAFGSENFGGLGGIVSGAVFCLTHEEAEKICDWWNREVESGHRVIPVEITGKDAAGTQIELSA